MHLKRWLTGLIALPILIFLIYKGGIYFSLLIGGAAFISLWEYYRIVLQTHARLIEGIPVVGMVTGLLIIYATDQNALDWVIGLLALNLIVTAVISVFKFKHSMAVLDVIQKQLQGIVYIPILMSFLILIRNGAEGMQWIFFLLCIVFAGDTAALYTGTFWGRHKLCPSVSPGKTIEGAIGGLIANAAVGALAKLLLLPTLAWTMVIPFCLIIGITAQVGDLFESELKRASNVKDSGVLLPGHGGFLDRIDALLFAAPVAYLFKVYIF